ncbi:MAG: hypothetical protein ABMA64_31855 [Myxococcota bacterium]
MSDATPPVEQAAEAEQAPLVRGRPFARPVLGLAAHEGAVAVRVGAAVGHGWWTMGDPAVRVGGESALRVTTPLGGASGYRVDLGTQAGPWFGPVGVSLGAAARAERERWDEDELPAALLAGPSLELAVDAGPVGVVGGVAPWFALTDRAPAGVGPAIGAETDWRLGLRGTLGPALVLAEGAARATAIGWVVELGIGLRLGVR